jgi:hypothetical protein
MNKTTIALIVAGIVILVGLGAYFLIRQSPSTPLATQGQPTTATTTNMQGGTEASTTQQEDKSETVIGTSGEGNEIVAYHYGTGDKEILFVGGIHGGYEWNTVSVAYDLMNYLQQHPEAVPQNETVTVIPVLNPDGLNKIVGTTSPSFALSAVPTTLAATVPGRFNAHNVDLNRNFDCDWQATGTWQNTPVSGGTSAFSEPESQAMRDYVQAHNLAAVVVWYSAAGAVYASSCHNGVLPETTAITKVYADASGYPAYESFDFYATTGDMVNWLAKNNIPAISVLLTNHTDVEWSKNQAGINALLQHYAQ